MKPYLLLTLAILMLTLVSALDHAPARALGDVSPLLLAAYSYNPCVPCAPPGDVVQFAGNWSIGPPASFINYTWNFGDGSPPVSTKNPDTIHLYFGIPSQWTVNLTITDMQGHSDMISQPVMFFVYPCFDYHPSTPVVGEPVIFNASSSISYENDSRITGYSWSFGDGTTGTGKIVFHSYSTPGSFRIILTLQTPSGPAGISETLMVHPVDTQGGETLPINMLSLLLPYLVSASILAGIIGGLYTIHRRRSVKQSAQVQ